MRRPHGPRRHEAGSEHSAEGPGRRRFAVVAARFYGELADRLVAGALEAFT